MAQAETLEHVWRAFWALPPASRNEFLERLVNDDMLRQELEDLLDLALARERSLGPTRPLEEVLAEIER
jgi:hypothetical protein